MVAVFQCGNGAAGTAMYAEERYFMELCMCVCRLFNYEIPRQLETALPIEYMLWKRRRVIGRAVAMVTGKQEDLLVCK